ncbi:MAG: phosphotransferase [Sulfurimonas sp.]|nr:phosphotransferase [Sulfurimonas sp.]
MGVKTNITLNKLNHLFNNYRFVSLTPTPTGMVDTTFIASTKDKDYILKKYERDISEKIKEDINLLNFLSSHSLNVPRCLDKNGVWYIYEKLSGQTPKVISTYHIQALSRFLAKMHKLTYKKKSCHLFYQNYKVTKLLNKIKIDYFSYYKKLSSLKSYTPKTDGIIHGDIFKDNTVFDAQKIGVFDFIDSGCGSFIFDLAVALIGYGVKKENKYFITLSLNTYNQKAPKKISLDRLMFHISIASKFYALLRIDHYNCTKKAKELL